MVSISECSHSNPSHTNHCYTEISANGDIDCSVIQLYYHYYYYYYSELCIFTHTLWSTVFSLFGCWFSHSLATKFILGGTNITAAQSA